MSPHIKFTKPKLAFGILALAATLGLGITTPANVSAKASLDDLFTNSGFTDRNLFRCALNAYKDANGMVSDYEVLSEASVAGNGGKTFYPEKAANVKNARCSYVSDASLTGLEQFSNLETVSISFYDGHATSASALASFPKLKYLNYYFTTQEDEQADISDLASLTNLEQLVIGGHIADYSPIGNLTNLKKLSIRWNSLSDLSFISTLTNLETLDLKDNNITDISPISSLSNLKFLALSGNDDLTDLSPLDGLDSLEYVDILDEREYDFAQEGDESVHPGFNDGVLYKAVVDSYYRQQGDYPLGDYPFFEIEYDKAAHRKEILTDEQLASIEVLENLDGTPWASRTPKLTDATGLALMPNLKAIIFDMMETRVVPDLSGNPKLEEFIVFAYTEDNIDFSHNPELRYVDLWQSSWLTSLDFSHNPKLQFLEVWADHLSSLDISACNALTQLKLMGTEIDKILLPDAPHFKEMLLTGSVGDSDNIESASVYLVPAPSVRLREIGGRGGDGDSEPAEADPYILDVSSLEFIQNNNTNAEGTLENETITPKDITCYSYDADHAVVIVKASCVEAGLKSATLVHAYTINGVDYVNEFDIDFNLDVEDEEETPDDVPAVPNTGIFVNEEGGANMANIAIALAGISIIAFIVLSLTRRLSTCSRARKF